MLGRGGTHDVPLGMKRRTHDGFCLRQRTTAAVCRRRATGPRRDLVLPDRAPRRAGSSHNRRRSPPPLPRGTRRLGRGAMGGVVFGGSKLASFYGSRMWHAIILHKGITSRVGGRSGRGRVIHCMLGNRWDDKITEMKSTYLRSAVQSLDGADLVLCMQGLWTRRGFPAAAGVVGMQRSARLW